MREATATFARWWWGELKELLPDRLVADGGVRNDRIVLQIEDGELLGFLCRSGDRVSELGRIATDGVDPADERAFAAALQAHLRRTAGARLQLADRWIVRRRINLPAAARENLRQVLAFEMDRHTPFRAADVYYDYRVVDEDGAGLTVELVAAPRQTVDAWTQRLARLGIALAAVGVAPDGENARRIRRGDDGINLLPDEQRPPPSDRALTPLNLGLAAVAGLLLIAALATPLVQMHRSVDALQSQTEAARASAEEVAALRDRLQTRIEEVRRLLSSKTDAPAVVELFAELVRILPDHTWLMNVQFKSGKFLIQGESESASDLLGLIEASPNFGDASFASPVTQNPATGRERFQISLHARQG